MPPDTKPFASRAVPPPEESRPWDSRQCTRGAATMCIPSTATPPEQVSATTQAGKSAPPTSARFYENSSTLLEHARPISEVPHKVDCDPAPNPAPAIAAWAKASSEISH